MSDRVIDVKSLLMAEGVPQEETVEALASKTGEKTKIDLSRSTMEALERAAIENTLRRTGGNKKEAAESLGFSLATIFNKIKKYGL